MEDQPARINDEAESWALERVSDADRERAAEFVQAALGDGRLGFDEIDQRLGAVMAARTRRDLEAALVHLPGADAVLSRAPLTSRTEPTTINGTHAKIQRTGRWDVPGHLIVTLVHSSVVLDIMEARLPGPKIQVDVDLTHSGIKLIVPDDIHVEHSGLEQHGSKVDVEPRQATGAPRAVIHLTGRLHWSKAAALPPGWRRRRALRKAVRPRS